MKTVLTTVCWAAIAAFLLQVNFARGQAAFSSPAPFGTVSTGSLPPGPAKDNQSKPNKDGNVTGGGGMANETRQTASRGKSGLLRISAGEDLSVVIPDLDKRAEKQPDIAATAKLFLDCRRVHAVAVRSCVSEKKLIFTLDRGAIRQITPKTKVVSVGVGFGDITQPQIVMPDKLQLVLVTFDGWFWMAVVMVVIIGLFLWGYGRHTGLLRDGGAPPTATPPVVSGSSTPAGGAEVGAAVKRWWRNVSAHLLSVSVSLLNAVKPAREELSTYSLAKVQMAWWLFFVISSLLFIWLAVGDFNSITGSTVILLGISTVTTIASRTISSAKQSAVQDLNAKEGALVQQVAQLNNQVTQVAATPSGNTPSLTQDLGATTTQLNQVRAQLTQLTVDPSEAKSSGFLTDIMSDENGISIHRFQMVAWTFVLTTIFVREVYTNLAMPQFNDTLLTLMGISSGTYIALKVQEKRSVVA